MDFLKPDYLKTGNIKQQKAYLVLHEHAVFEILKEFDPILVGTIPINIDIAQSDLDIICCWSNKKDFISSLEKHFSKKKSFSLKEFQRNGNDTVVCRFHVEAFEIEIFAQNTPSIQQSGYQHMIIEYEILKQKGEEFRQQIINLKKQGIKTEPAFAKLLNIEGDPYIELLNYNTGIFRTNN